MLCLIASVYSLVLFAISKQIRLPSEILVWHFCFLANDFCYFFLVTIMENVNRFSGAGSLAVLCFKEVVSRKMSSLPFVSLGSTALGRSERECTSGRSASPEASTPWLDPVPPGLIL